MNPTAEPAQLPDPTLDDLVNVARTARLDRLSFVRRARPDRAAGVLVLMFGAVATRELGRFLIDVAKRCPPKRLEKLVADGSTLARGCLEAIETNGSEWGWGEIAIQEDNQIGLLFLLIGPQVTDQFAAELTRRGCVTKLE